MNATADPKPGRTRNRAAETPRYYLSLPLEYAEALQALAAKTRRTLSAAAQVALDAALRAEGVAVPAPVARQRPGPRRRAESPAA